MYKSKQSGLGEGGCRTNTWNSSEVDRYADNDILNLQEFLKGAIVYDRMFP